MESSYTTLYNDLLAITYMTTKQNYKSLLKAGAKLSMMKILSQKFL